MANKRCFSFFKKSNSLEELKGFTGIEVFFEKDSNVRLVHKETDSEGVCELGNNRSIESMIIDFYCFVKRLTISDFLEFTISEKEKMKIKTDFVNHPEVRTLSFTKPEKPSELSCYFDQNEKKVKVFINQEWADYSKDVFSKAKPIRSQAALDDERLNEIVETIVKYRKSNMAIPPDWIKEYNEILERINNQPKTE